MQIEHTQRINVNLTTNGEEYNEDDSLIKEKTYILPLKTSFKVNKLKSLNPNDLIKISIDETPRIDLESQNVSKDVEKDKNSIKVPIKNSKTALNFSLSPDSTPVNNQDIQMGSLTQRVVPKKFGLSYFFSESSSIIEEEDAIMKILNNCRLKIENNEEEYKALSSSGAVPISYDQMHMISDKSLAYIRHTHFVMKKLSSRDEARYGEGTNARLLRKSARRGSDLSRSSIRSRSLLDKMKESKYLFSPNANYKVIWDILCMIIIVYEILMVPFFISFDVSPGVELAQVDFVITMIFFLDIVITMNTGYFDRGILIMKRKEILKEYLKFWFWVDLLSTFPYNWIEIDPLDFGSLGSDDIMTKKFQNSAKLLKIFRALRFVKIIRMLRVFKLKKMINKIELYLNLSVTFSASLGFLKLGLMILCIAHWLACIWHFTGFNDNTYPRNWLTLFGIQNEQWQIRYVSSIYWATTTMITIGYGDIVPCTINEKIIAMGAMFIGCCMFAFVMNRMNELLIQLKSSTYTYRSKLTNMMNYLQKKRVNFELRGRIKKFVEFMLAYNAEFNTDQANMLLLLSDNLKNELLIEINYKITMKANVLTDNFSKQVIEELCYILKEKNYTIDEVIFDVRLPQFIPTYMILFFGQEDNNDDKNLYIIKTGAVQIYANYTNIVYKVIDRGCFGEIAFFTGMNRTASAKAVDYSRIFTIDRDQFMNIISKYPLDFERFNMIKDNITINENYGDLKILCYSCHRRGHTVRNCPILHYEADKAIVISKYQARVIKIQDKIAYAFSKFLRPSRSKMHELWSYKNLKSTAERINACNKEQYSNGVSNISRISGLKSILVQNEGEEGKLGRSYMTMKSKLQVKKSVNFALKANEFDADTCLKQLFKFKESLDAPTDFCIIRRFNVYFPHNNFNNVLGDYQALQAFHKLDDCSIPSDSIAKESSKGEVPDESFAKFDAVDINKYVFPNVKNGQILHIQDHNTSSGPIFEEVKEVFDDQYIDLVKQNIRSPPKNDSNDADDADADDDDYEYINENDDDDEDPDDHQKFITKKESNKSTHRKDNHTKFNIKMTLNPNQAVAHTNYSPLNTNDKSYREMQFDSNQVKKAEKYEFRQKSMGLIQHNITDESIILPRFTFKKTTDHNNFKYKEVIDQLIDQYGVEFVKHLAES